MFILHPVLSVSILNEFKPNQASSRIIFLITIYFLQTRSHLKSESTQVLLMHKYKHHNLLTLVGWIHSLSMDIMTNATAFDNDLNKIKKNLIVLCENSVLIWFSAIEFSCHVFYSTTIEISIKINHSLHHFIRMVLHRLLVLKEVSLAISALIMVIKRQEVALF